MNLPIQSQPVMRNVSTAAFSGGIEASNAACTAACLGCRALGGIGATLCLAAAQSSGCKC